MIVCVCKRVNSAQIRASMAEGRTLEEISAELGVGTGCGRCLEFASQMIERESSGTFYAA